MQLAEFTQQLRTLGAKELHVERLFRNWLIGLPLLAGTKRQRSEDFFPLEMRQAASALENFLHELATVSADHPAQDGSARLLVTLRDQQMIESVLLPREGLCISSQVGCAVGCVFCMTGKSGLIRQVSSLEMLAQVALARRRRRVKKVVFMGMGEPAHNLENVLETIDILGRLGEIGHKNLVFSSVGDMRVFERLPQMTVRPALALSLHTTDAQLREQLLPKAPKITPRELIDLGEDYARTGAYPIQYQWTLLRGINDTFEEMERVVELLQGKYAVLNLIPYNSLEGDEYARPDFEHTRALVRFLMRNKILTKVRNSAGQDIDGGCGQLRARAAHLKPNKAGKIIARH